MKIQDLARVIKRNAEAMFGKEFLSESESTLLAQFSFGYRGGSSAAQFVELFDRLVAEYLRICPEAVISRDFKQAVSGIYFRLFYNAWKTKVFPPAWCFFLCRTYSCSQRWKLSTGRAEMFADRDQIARCLSASGAATRLRPNNLRCYWTLLYNKQAI